MKLCAILVFALIGFAVSENVEPSDDQVKSLVDQLDNEESLPLFGGLSLEKVEKSEEVSPRSAESLTDRLVRYIKSHELKFDISEARSSVGGKTKPVIVKKIKKARGKLKKLALPLLLALKFKSAVILPVVFTLLTLVSLKALKVGLVALLLAGSSFVKDLFAKKQEKVTTAYISANPQSQGFNAEIVTDWNRNGAAAGDMAYNGYQAPNYQTLPQNI